MKMGVGYDLDTRSKDGCLHLYDAAGGNRSPAACLDADGQWWIRENPQEPFQLIRR